MTIKKPKISQTQTIRDSNFVDIDESINNSHIRALETIFDRTEALFHCLRAVVKFEG